ncbi:MAG TPA: Uma2 family endonuclease [Humisphaera sp.]
MTLMDAPIVSSADTVAEPRAFRWTREAYYWLYEQGRFDGRRVELIDGEIIEMPAQKHVHAWSIVKSERALRPVAEPANCIRTQMPLNLSQWSDPEPDLAVVLGAVESWEGKEHPTSALLVVEVADTTLAFDRRVKQAIYAAAGIQEYWIVNLVDRQLEVYRDPRPDPQNARASRYADVTTLSPQDVVSPLAFPAARLVAGTLFG